MTYHTFQKAEFFPSVCADTLKITAPNGKETVRGGFTKLPVTFTYDVHGYETVEAAGEGRLCFRVFFDCIGEHILTFLHNGEVVQTETVTVTEGVDPHGIIGISQRDRRYFAYADGTPFLPIGINLVYPTEHRVSTGVEFERSTVRRYFGLRQYERWFRECRKNGVNLIRLWLGCDYFSPDTDQCDAWNDLKFEVIDAVVELARSYGIKVKLTVEHFRFFLTQPPAKNEIPHAFAKYLCDGDRPCSDMTAWLTEVRWQEAWLGKIERLAARFAGDPTVFCVELWNEMNAVDADYALTCAWNRKMLPRVALLFAPTMTVNSLGSMDSEPNTQIYRGFPWEYSAFQQVHRYLDLGAPFAICHTSLCEALADAVRVRTPAQQPLLVAETGAVDDCHSGPFGYYSCDHRGLLFVDAVYTPFFCGSAGCGNLWHWDWRYVESKNLYRYFAPLAAMVKDLDPAQEEFVPDDCSNEDAYLYLLRGSTVTLGFVRNRRDDWQTVLRDNAVAPAVAQAQMTVLQGDLTLYPIWEEETAQLSLEGNTLSITDLHYGLCFCIKHA